MIEVSKQHHFLAPLVDLRVRRMSKYPYQNTVGSRLKIYQKATVTKRNIAKRGEVTGVPAKNKKKKLLVFNFRSAQTEIDTSHVNPQKKEGMKRESTKLVRY